MKEDMEEVMDWEEAMVETINRFCTHSSTLHCSFWIMLRRLNWGTLVEFMEDLEETMGEVLED